MLVAEIFSHKRCRFYLRHLAPGGLQLGCCLTATRQNWKYQGMGRNPPPHCLAVVTVVTAQGSRLGSLGSLSSRPCRAHCRHGCADRRSCQPRQRVLWFPAPGGASCDRSLCADPVAPVGWILRPGRIPIRAGPIRRAATLLRAVAPGPHADLQGAHKGFQASHVHGTRILGLDVALELGDELVQGTPNGLKACVGDQLHGSHALLSTTRAAFHFGLAVFALLV
mmetsp:Transcript_120874/g.170007  ORF Transcript_120874/g.170007 Transcript_120874/m.170007 type:complete len:224 (+) Transcript_120874:62-733(+)